MTVLNRIYILLKETTTPISGSTVPDIMPFDGVKTVVCADRYGGTDPVLHAATLNVNLLRRLSRFPNTVQR
jgi:hypothetical protein